MVKKPAAVAKKPQQHKAAPEGPSITRFFDPRPASTSPPVKPHAANAPPPAVPPGDVTPPGPAPDWQVPPQPQQQLLPGLAWRPKHLVEADACMMSQDTDALCVVWHDSPGASQPLGTAAGGGPARLAAAAGALPHQPHQDFGAIKQRLISAAQRPRGPPARAGQHPLAASRPGVGSAAQAADALLEGLFAHGQQPEPEGRPGGAVSARPAPECSILSASLSDVGVPPGAGTTHRTPATHLRGILKKAQPGGGAQRTTPGSSVKFSLGGGGSSSTAAKLATSRSARQGGGASKARRQSGQKRKALLELLEQVESLVQSGGSQDDEEAEGESQDPADEGEAQDKENSQLQNSQDAAPAAAAKAPEAGHCGPSQEQQACQQPLVTVHHQPEPRGAPPPAGPGPLAQQAPPPSRVQQAEMRPVQVHSRHPTFPPTTTGMVPSHGPPQAVALAGPSADNVGSQVQRSSSGFVSGPAPAAQPQMQQLHPLQAPVLQQQAPQPPQQQPPPPQPPPPQPPPPQQDVHSSGGFGDDDMDAEEDALLAELEMQLVAQIEQRQAAAAAARAQPQSQAAAAPLQAPAGPMAGGAIHPSGSEVAGNAAPAPAAPMQVEGDARSGGGGPEPQQLQPLQSAGGGAMAGGAALADAAGPAAMATDSWDDDWDDGEMLAQAEAAALRDRAERSLHGEPPGPSNRPATPAPQAVPKYPGDRENVHYTITEVINSEHDQILRLYNKHKGQEVFAHLRSPWSDLPYRVGDAVNLVAKLDCFDSQLHCLLDMEHGLLVLHPDVLLSGTRITGSNSCPRQSLLDERIAGDGSSAVAVKGTLQHSLIQAALQENLRTARELHRKAEEIVGASVEALLEVDMDEAGALAYLKEATPGILRWMNRFLKDIPGQEGLVSGGFDPVTNREIRRCISVPEVVDIEESVWSTKFGVKGMVDVSVKLALDDLMAVRQRQQQQQQQARGWAQSAVQRPAEAPPEIESVIAPVEIKTGKPHDSHRAQVLLYLLLMEERYGTALDWGLLWYTTQPDPQLVKRKPYELASLMAVRNRLASYIAHNEMAPLADFKKQCHWCFQKQNCALYHKAIEGGTADSFKHVSTDRGSGDPHNVQGIFDKGAGHLSPSDCEFLKKWDRLIDLEEGGILTRRAEIWSLTGEEREKLGRCLAGLVLSHVDEAQGLYTFRRAAGSSSSGFAGSAFTEGEMVVLSIEGQHVTVARAVIYTLTAGAVTVSLKKPLRRGLLLPAEMSSGVSTTQPAGQVAQRAQQAGAGAGGAAPMAVDGSAAGGTAGPGPGAEFDPSVRWRLDRDDISSTIVKLRGNLFSLFRPEDERAERLRQLIVDLAPPQAAPLEGGVDPTPAGMNSEQYAAVHRVLAAKDYTLVLGMPGAGKTTTIVSMVQALVALGKSVLVTSYTNSAVDNILMKLAGEGVPFVRLGREQTVHPAVRPWVPGGERHPHKTVATLRQLGETVPVVGATCFGVSHAMLKSRVFDVCILDEAGQVTIPASLGPLLKSRAFVLVGDHNQLPPLVANKEAEEGGMGVSLFKRLSEAHPQAVVSLPVQYRMAADIMELANQLFYDNRLRCGTPAVAEGALALPAAGRTSLAGLPDWLQQVLLPERRVLFLDTADAGAAETLAGDTLSNAGEAELVLRVLRAAAAAGVGQERLGVISPYRAQVSLLDRLVREADLGGVECLTVDKCQGRDKDCVLVSFVRSNAQHEAGKLLQDWRRINVALTRAKSKLVLVGDAATLGTLPLFQRLLSLVRERGWYMRLPSGAV